MSEAQIQRAAEYIKEHLPSGAAVLWALVNNVSWAAFGEVEWIPIDVYRRAADLNLLGAIRLTQVFLPSIRKSKGNVLCLVTLIHLCNQKF